jgi:hypothetical protein
MKYRGRIIQDGMPVAWAEADNEADMLREMMHYASVYQQDGPVQIEFREGNGKWKMM